MALSEVDSAHLQRLYQACEQLGLLLEAGEAESLLGYVAQLQRWNRTYNLTAVRDPDQMLSHHVIDSLSVLPALKEALSRPETAQARIYDVGSGAGLPGVVLAIMCPHWQITCIDAVEKKTAFVRQLIGTLKLSNLASLHARIETLPPAECDVVISRAFASLVDFATLGGRHVSEGGSLVAMKGKIPDDEIAALHAQTSWKVTKVETLNVPELDAQRCLIWMRRSQGTS
jgi:16S rRNA (guanine527-N7)-methyltransferase